MLKKLCAVLASFGVAASLCGVPTLAFADDPAPEGPPSAEPADPADAADPADPEPPAEPEPEPEPKPDTKTDTKASTPKKKTGKLKKTSYSATVAKVKIAKAGSSYSSVKINVEVPKATKKSKVKVVSDSAQRYSATKKKMVKDVTYAGSTSKLKKHLVVLKLRLAGTHKIVIDVDGVEYSLKAKVKAKAAKSSYLMLYKGQKLQLQSGLAGVTWKSSSPLVAKVSKTGEVKSSEVGKATLTATISGVKLTCSIESTYKKAYQAVKNAYKDFKTKISYSQGLRMKRYYRDCSSFVARTYWDNLLGRKLLSIGGSAAKSWALPADDQALWLQKKGRTVAYSRTSVSNLLPGDTIYVISAYAGGGGYRGINHASIYVGNGKLLDGTGTGGIGTVGYRKYATSNVRYIGRPCAALELDRSTATLREGWTTTLKAKYASGKVSWSSSDKKVAKVNSSGKVTAVKKGTATITAKSGTKSYSCRIVVKEPLTFTTKSAS